MTIYGLAGIIGVALYLGSYTALQLGLIAGRGYLYALLNLAASSCVLISLIEAFNLSSAMIQISWITISIVGMARFYVINSSARFTEQERAFLTACLPKLSPADGRKLLDLALWFEGTPGEELIREGEPVSHLFWVSTGRVAVSSGGRDVSIMGEDSFIGEITVLSGDPATASARFAEPTLCLCFPAGPLRDLAAKNAEIRLALQDSFSDHLRRKLTRSTQSVAEAQAASDNALGTA
ncbi:MAG: cyclic nucleotide-binding domain-containing protein [Pseudomonadota bacterium]